MIFVQAELGSYKGDISVTVTDALNYLPGNIFWGMGVYALFALFLFARPKLFSKNKKLSVLWKSFVIIPLFYLIISMVYSCLVNAKVWNAMPYYVSFLMFPKGLCITVIVCAFCLFVKYFRTIAIVLLGHKNAETFFKGNQYILAKNITACILILLVGIVDLILHYTVSSDNVYMKALNLGNNFYTPLVKDMSLFFISDESLINNSEDLEKPFNTIV